MKKIHVRAVCVATFLLAACADFVPEVGTGASAQSGDAGSVSFEAEELEPPLRALAEERGWKAGDLFMAIRVAVTGRTATPPLFDTLVALGQARTLVRMDRAIAVLRRADPGS